MKKVFVVLFAALLTGTVVQAQNVDLRRKISVSGTAETEVTPDIIYINISLKEYLENGNSRKKTDITALENQLFEAVKNAGLSKENLTINNVSSWMYTTEKKKNPDFLASKQYLLKVADLFKLNQILGAIDPKGIQSTSIQSYEYSKIASLKKELKIKALQAAMEKATYMVATVGGKLGDILDIQDGNDSPGAPVMYRNFAMKAADASTDEADLDFKKIKLSFTVNTVFEIK